MTPLAESAAIILGASEWPGSDGFDPHPAFRNSAEFFRDYLAGNGLPRENLLWLFDDPREPFGVTSAMLDFLRERANGAVRNILLYYVGHGAVRHRDYYLALRCTRLSEMELSALAFRHVARKLLEEVSDKRQVIILDACYASAAVGEFVAQAAAAQAQSDADIKYGTSVFCAAGPTEANAPRDAEYTMFSGALRRILTAGCGKIRRPLLTLEEVAMGIQADIHARFRQHGVRPELHTPRQQQGDIRTLPLFPNPGWRPRPDTPEVRALRAELDALRRAVEPLARELEWEHASRQEGHYESLALRKEIDQFGDMRQRHRIVGITGPRDGEIATLPYNFRTEPELGTCVVEEIRDEHRHHSAERSKLPAPAASVSGTLVLRPPATAGTVHRGFTVRTWFINAFAVTLLDAKLRGEPEIEKTSIRPRFPARYLRLIVSFPAGYAPPETPQVSALLPAEGRPLDEWEEDAEETARIAPGFHFDAARAWAILQIERALPRFEYTMKWHLPAQPESQMEEAPRAREEVRNLVALGTRERTLLGNRLAAIRDAVCRQPLGWRDDQPRNVHLALLVFDEDRAVTEVVAATDGPGRTLGLPWGAGLVGWVMRRRRPVFVDTRQRGASGIYRAVPSLPMERYVLCVPLPLPSDSGRRGELLLDRSIPCAVASLSCVDESGNMARLMGPKPAASVAPGTLLGGIASGLAGAVLDLLADASPQ
ncbi:MAG TPA: hypothetical protein VHY76_05960 [Acetobacteraceae bacterium]|nr:hypothetical protein [Acetobacteraceae bacterium]